MAEVEDILDTFVSYVGGGGIHCRCLGLGGGCKFCIGCRGGFGMDIILVGTRSILGRSLVDDLGGVVCSYAAPRGVEGGI